MRSVAKRQADGGRVMETRQGKAVGVPTSGVPALSEPEPGRRNWETSSHPWERRPRSKGGVGEHSSWLPSSIPLLPRLCSCFPSVGPSRSWLDRVRALQPPGSRLPHGVDLSGRGQTKNSLCTIKDKKVMLRSCEQKWMGSKGRISLGSSVWAKNWRKIKDQSVGQDLSKMHYLDHCTCFCKANGWQTSGGELASDAQCVVTVVLRC